MISGAVSRSSSARAGDSQAAADRELGLDEQRVRVVRGGGLPVVEPLVAAAGEGGEPGDVAVAVLPLGGLAGGGEQLGGGPVVAAGRGDERGARAARRARRGAPRRRRAARRRGAGCAVTIRAVRIRARSNAMV